MKIIRQLKPKTMKQFTQVVLPLWSKKISGHLIRIVFQQRTLMEDHLGSFARFATLFNRIEQDIAGSVRSVFLSLTIIAIGWGLALGS